MIRVPCHHVFCHYIYIYTAVTVTPLDCPSTAFDPKTFLPVASVAPVATAQAGYAAAPPGIQVSGGR